MAEEGFRGGIGAAPEAAAGADGSGAIPEEAARLPEPTFDIKQFIVDQMNEITGPVILELKEDLAQLKGQVVNLETFGFQVQDRLQKDIPQTFMQVDARFNALAQQLMRNIRIEAARIAASCRQPGEPGSNIIDLYRKLVAEFERSDGPAESAAAPETGNRAIKDAPLFIKPPPDASKDN